MGPPPITPSPHRFITSKPSKSTPKQSSSLRFQQQPTQSSSSQFAPAPKFNFSSTPKHLTDNATVATQYSSPLSRRPQLPPVKTKEDIEEANSDQEDEQQAEDASTRSALPVHPTSKRRRPNPPEAITISSTPSSSPTSTPPLPTTEHEEPFPQRTTAQTPIPHHAPRFVLPHPTPSITTPSIPSRPPLILPPRSPSPPPEPPAFFSPHRKGQKYVPGGLASTVRDWIVETAQVGYTHAHAKKRGEEAWDAKVVVGECRTGDVGMGMMLVRERGGERGWILAGRGRGDLAGRGRGEGVVEVGCVVGVKEPIWEVEIEGQRWRVGVEWKVLDG